MKMNVCDTCGNKSLDGIVRWEVENELGELEIHEYPAFPISHEDGQIDMTPIVEEYPEMAGDIVKGFDFICPECGSSALSFEEVEVEEFPIVIDFSLFDVDYAFKILRDIYYYNNPEENCLFDTLPGIEVRGLSIEEVVQLYALLFQDIEGDKTLRFIDEELDKGNKSFEDAMDLTK